MNLDKYDYFLPKKNLALKPAIPRDSSKLFAYNTKTDEIIFDHFYNLDKYLSKDSFLVLNNTKVLPARVTMKKNRLERISILLILPIQRTNINQRFMIYLRDGRRSRFL